MFIFQNQLVTSPVPIKNKIKKNLLLFDLSQGAGFIGDL
jgi:hypothetical protein